MRVRAGQREFERLVELHRICGLLARRQYGKTTIASRISLKKMMKVAGHTVIFGSVKLDLGREIVRKESAAMQAAIRSLSEAAAQGKALFDIVDQTGGKSVAKLNADDFAELYEAQRLEFQLWHSNTVYSRTKVVALTPAAVGETGDLILDEVGRVKNFREVWEAVRPIIASNPDFRCVLTTTPPPDDSHYSFELLAPPLHADFKVNPKGNSYRSELGVFVLRIDAWDAAADGVVLYDDDTGKPISPEESRRQEADKDAWDRNYGVKFVLGGTAACGLLQLDSAQRRGIGECTLIVVESEADVTRACEYIREHVGPGEVGLGWDLATTEKEKSNPSSFTVMERQGVEKIGRITVVWKTADPLVAKDRVRRLIEAVAERPDGGPARRLCVDATNERYFATEVQRDFAALLPVELVIASETIEKPGEGPMTMKAFLGSQLVGELDDNHLTLAPERYLKDDFRLVKKDRGSFTTEISPDGKHGDTFDSHKLALHGLLSTNDRALMTTEGIKMGSNHRRTFKPARLGRERNFAPGALETVGTHKEAANDFRARQQRGSERKRAIEASSIIYLGGFESAISAERRLAA